MLLLKHNACKLLNTLILPYFWQVPKISQVVRFDEFLSFVLKGNVWTHIFKSKANDECNIFFFFQNVSFSIYVFYLFHKFIVYILKRCSQTGDSSESIENESHSCHLAARKYFSFKDGFWPHELPILKELHITTKILMVEKWQESCGCH